MARTLVGGFGGWTAAGIGEGNLWGPRPREDGGNAERVEEGATRKRHSPEISVITQAGDGGEERRLWIEELRRSLS